MTTSRCLRRRWLAKPRLGRFSTNGRAAAPMPRSRRNSRRVRVVGHRRSSPGGTVGHADRVGDLGVWHSCAVVVRASRPVRADVAMISTISLRMLIVVLGERPPQVGEPVRAVGADRLLDQVVEQLLDERVVRLLAAGQERRPARGRRRTSTVLAGRGSGRPRSRRSACPSPRSRNRPTASKCSSVKPSGLIIAVARLARLRASSAARRARGSSGPACRSAASGATASGGGRSARPSTLRARKTPRWIGELVAV